MKIILFQSKIVFRLGFGPDINHTLDRLTQISIFCHLHYNLAEKCGLILLQSPVFLPHKYHIEMISNNTSFADNHINLIYSVPIVF